MNAGLSTISLQVPVTIFAIFVYNIKCFHRWAIRWTNSCYSKSCGANLSGPPVGLRWIIGDHLWTAIGCQPGYIISFCSIIYQYCGMTSLHAILYICTRNSSSDNFVPVNNATTQHCADRFINLWILLLNRIDLTALPSFSYLIHKKQHGAVARSTIKKQQRAQALQAEKSPEERTQKPSRHTKRSRYQHLKNAGTGGEAMVETVQAVH